MQLTRPDPSDSRWFRQVLGQYPTGVCVVTATTPEGERAGFVVGSFTSVSLAPPLVAFFPDKSSTSWPKIHGAGRCCVNILGAHQEDLCRRFASKADDKFAGLDCTESGSGAPIVDEAVAWIDCDIESVQEAGDHYIVLARVRELDIGSGALPLLFFQGGYGRFAPLSLAAPDASGALTRQLREVDLVRPEMELLAEDLSARCLATARAGEELVVTASAGSANTTSTATLVGQRLPFGPPTGSAFIAWSGQTESEEWHEHRERLAAVRRRGYSVGLLNEAQRVFASALDRLAVEPGSVSSEDLRGLIGDLAYDPVELSAEARNDIRVISVPVFGPDCEVALVLTLYGFPKPPEIGGIDHHIDRVCRAASRGTERLRA